MKVELSNAFQQIGRHLPTYAPVLEDIERHLREMIAGEHTMQEFAEHYCLDRGAKAIGAKPVR